MVESHICFKCSIASAFGSPNIFRDYSVQIKLRFPTGFSDEDKNLIR